MSGVAALKAALAAGSSTAAQDAFERLTLGQQNIVLDAVTVGQQCSAGTLRRVWITWHGGAADTWATELQQWGMLSVDNDNDRVDIEPALAELARSIIQNPQSDHCGTRLWVEEGRIVGEQQGHAVLTANLMLPGLVDGASNSTSSALAAQQLSGMPSIDFSQARILILGPQQLPKQLLSGQLQQLLHLHLSDNTLTQLPDAIGRLTALRDLEITCSQLTALPESFDQLAALQKLRLSNCSQLAALPESFNKLSALQEWFLIGCSQLTALPDSLSQLAALQTLELNDCSQLAALPKSFGQLSALQKLHLRSCRALTRLPQSISGLQELLVLSLNFCVRLAALPASLGQLVKLRNLELMECSSLTALPEALGQLTALSMLDLSYCSQLAALPESIGQLTALSMLDLSDCCQLAALPESIGRLKALSYLDLDGCDALKALPDSMEQLHALEDLDLEGCDSLVQPPPDDEWAPQRKIQHVLALQRQMLARHWQQSIIVKLAAQQDTMLTTLERMSWLALLLATATFVAFLQPPGGTEDGQVLVSGSSACAWGSMPVGSSDAAGVRKCAMLVFFILDGLSFGFSMGCVMMIIVLSMPRLKYADEQLEAGRFWLLLLVTWMLLYCAVLTGFGAFIASGLAVHNRWGVVVGPVIPGMLLLVVGFAVIVTRFQSLHPGAAAIKAAMSPRSSRHHAKPEDPDIELGQNLFWKHCKQVITSKQQQKQKQKQQQQQHEHGATAGHGADETSSLLAQLDPGAGSSHGT